MFGTIEDFVSEWTRESELTEKLLQALTDESLAQVVVPGYRSLGELAWHLVESLNYMPSILPVTFTQLAEGEQAPLAADAITREYRRISRDMLEAIQTQWSDATLAETVDMGNGWGIWSNAASLRFTVMHQAHHRGQMTVSMRLAGLRVPALYGPTREDWIEMGQDPRK